MAQNTGRTERTIGIVAGLAVIAWGIHVQSGSA